MIIEITIFAVAVALFLVVWRVESRWRFVLSPFIILMYHEFVRILPAFALSQSSVFHIASSNYPLIVATLAFFFLVFGFVCGYFYKPISSTRVLALTMDRGPKLKLDRAETVGVFILAVLLVIMGLYFYDGIPLVAYSVKSLLIGAGGDEVAVAVRDMRYELTKSHYFGGKYRGQGIIRTVQFLGWSLICCYTLVTSMERQTIRAVMVFLFSFGIAWLFVAGDGTRGHSGGEQTSCIRS